MDLSSFSAAVSALKAAKDLGTALLDLRDFNQVAATTSKLNGELLKAQDSLFTAQSKMLELQSEHMEVLNKLRELEKGAEQRSRYQLVEIGPGVFAYRLKDPQHREDGGADKDEPIHYLCQPCWDVRKHRSVLMKGFDGFFVSLNCPNCGTKFRTGEKIEMHRIDVSRFP